MTQNSEKSKELNCRQMCAAMTVINEAYRCQHL